jgi:diadenosine tetraphosphate (Ap4A) HIT family hydrolase
MNGENAFGTTLLIWRGRHIAEVTEMSDAELDGYLRETHLVARALNVRFEPLKLHYYTYGNHIPHLHSVIVTRYPNDGVSNGPLWWSQGSSPHPAEEMRRVAGELATLTAAGGPPLDAGAPTTGDNDWPESWNRWRLGDDCPFCLEGRPDERDIGDRFFAGEVTDAYLLHSHSAAGSTLVISRGRHASDPMELPDDEVLRYWLEIRKVAAAIERRYAPIKLNFGTAGTHVPHLHTVIATRFDDDGAPNGRLMWTQSAPRRDAEATAAELKALGALLEGGAP